MPAQHSGSRGISDIHAFVDELAFDLESDEFFFLHDVSNDAVCGIGGIVETGVLCPFVNGWLEKGVDKLLLSLFPDTLWDIFPHVAHEDGILERRVSAKLTENLEVAPRDLSESYVGNTVHVNDPGEP